MIDEKTKEPMQEAPSAPPVKHKRTLRSLWAQLQCSRLLRKHRFRRKTQRRMNDLSQKLRGSALVLRVGETLYALGFAAEYAVVRTGRNLSAVARWLAHGIRNVFHELAALAFPGAAQMFRDLFGPRGPEGERLRHGRQSQRPLSHQRHPAQPSAAAPDGHVHPAGVYAGGVRDGV